MPKFNEIQKKRRAKIQEEKRAKHGDPNTGRLKQRCQPLSISGKRKRKLLKKWKREQKEMIEKGLVTMKDVEMSIADGGTSQDNNQRTQMKFHVKKGSKLRIKKLKGKGKNSKGKSAKLPTDAPIDAMVE